ncbi:hypothetical protein GCM10008959_31570 [Deinococcus seoulensis]|uniref:SEFIR domain-containing protein n=1 Tax=Deinococcus seoulensis TaxID=1837379 RepID=A0ABQ2RXW0_9DEIO|nr:toll/interleukin-1 receptor domain-containing protein [Deinococcus seoulensis]GGR67082.1 hypothetical protein GCM10008959_31570 [Deinococcus seoulensis]
MTREPPLTFFSYAWTTEAHKARVRALADRLRGDGVDVILDQTHLQAGDDTFQFMEQIASRPDLKKVVVICDQRYKQKVDGRQGGSGTEGTIMSPGVYQQIGEGPNKFVAVAFETDERGTGFVPTMFATRLYIDMSTDELQDANYERLLRFLWDRPEPPAPLGRPPEYLFDGDPTDALVHSKAKNVRMAVERGRGPLTPWQELVDAVLGVFARFSAPLSATRQYDGQEAMRQVEWTIPARDALTETVRFLVREDRLTAVMLIDLFTRLGHVARRHEQEWSVQAEVTAHTRAAVLELVLYVVAVLIQEDQPALLGEVLNTTYVQDGGYGNIEATVFAFVWGDAGWFAEEMEARPGRRTQAGVADWMKARATLAGVPFWQLVQADVLLSANTVQGIRGTPLGPMYQMWYPVLGSYWASQPLPLFKRLMSEAVLKRWLPVFRQDSLQSMIEAGPTVFQYPDERPLVSRVSLEQLFGISQLGRRM